jgi:hypothetical protein
MSGTVDVQLHCDDTIEIIDYKDGMGVVSAIDNPQLEQYAYGVLSDAAKNGLSYQFVKMTIIQPKLMLKGMEPITSHIVTVESLLQKVSVIVAQAAATDDPDAPLVAGEVQCKFCRAKGSCAALAKGALKEVGIMFQPVVSQSLDVAQQSANKDPSAMTDAELVQVLEAAPLLRQLLESAETEAQRRLEAGHSIKGIKLVSGRGSRSWALPDEDMAKVLTKMGVPKTALYETKIISPAKADKLMWARKDGTRVQLSEKQTARLTTEYVRKTVGKPTVALESDSRQAVITNAAPLFSAVTVAPATESLPSWLL